MEIPNTDSETDPGPDRPINITYFLHNIDFKHISRPYLFLNYGNKNTLRCGLSVKKPQFRKTGIVKNLSHVNRSLSFCINCIPFFTQPLSSNHGKIQMAYNTAHMLTQSAKLARTGICCGWYSREQTQTDISCALHYQRWNLRLFLSSVLTIMIGCTNVIAFYWAKAAPKLAYQTTWPI